MSKLTLTITLCVLCCALQSALCNNFYYYPNPGLNYQYQPFSPYVYSAYALPVDCDKSSTTEGGESTSSESSSGESTESGSTEGGSSSESSSEESKKEGGESSETSSSGGEEEGGKKEEGSGEGKKEDSKKKVTRYVFPPVSSYPYPQTGQQIVYSAPASYAYMPYKTYSVLPQTANYKSSGYNAAYPYYSLSGIPSGYSSRIVSSPAVVAPAASYPGVSKTITFSPASGVGGPAGYWNGNVGYYRV